MHYKSCFLVHSIDVEASSLIIEFMSVGVLVFCHPLSAAYDPDLGFWIVWHCENTALLTSREKASLQTHVAQQNSEAFKFILSFDSNLSITSTFNYAHSGQNCSVDHGKAFR